MTASQSQNKKVYTKFYIDGRWIEPLGTGTLEVVDSATEEVIGRIPDGTPEDIDAAVKAARESFESWASTPVSERAAYLRELARILSARNKEIAEIVSAEVGMPIGLSARVQAGLPASVMASYADLVEAYKFEEKIGNSLVVREPIGVVGCITPWNFPLHQVVAKAAPALAVGCTVVLKPSEVAPLTAFLLAEAIHNVGLPKGVFNLVTGTGPVVGEALAGHTGVDMISFTGSTRAGRRVSELAARTIKRVALELGGKSANIILDDADFDKAVKSGVNNCFFNSGQTCSAWTRMLVPRGKHEEATRIAKETAELFKVGDPRQPGVKLGPLVSATQLERVRSYIQKGIDEGAALITGGVQSPDGLERGYFVRPTVFGNVKSGMTIAQEEIFGPVLSIIPYDSEEEAIRIANDTIYGLAGAVWSSDPERARRVAVRLRTGQVDINGGAFNPMAPFGGYKQSGNGREFGKYGLEEFLEPKSLQM
jgi:acyl-CoA reductase-like NAD-dependent aldehyde dehydrogenase